MKIAVTYKDGNVFQHFGHTEEFKMYNVENGAVVSSEVVSAAGSGHGMLAGFLKNHGVQILICGGIGGGARNALGAQGIMLYPGASGDADQQVANFIAGQLAYDPNTKCNHHGEGHTCSGHDHDHGHDHNCGGSCHK